MTVSTTIGAALMLLSLAPMPSLLAYTYFKNRKKLSLTEMRISHCEKEVENIEIRFQKELAAYLEEGGDPMVFIKMKLKLKQR